MRRWDSGFWKRPEWILEFLFTDLNLEGIKKLKRMATNQQNIRDFLGLRKPKDIFNDDFDTKIQNYCSYFNISSRPRNLIIPKVSSNALLGLEVEVEGDDNLSRAMAQSIPYWSNHPDGSLRNGVEFITAPIPFTHVAKAVHLLNETFRISSTKCDYSWRTSLHVHCNVQDLSVEQFKNLMKLYMVFEPLFFQMCGGDRENSNFCVPLYKSTMDQVYHDAMQHKDDSTRMLLTLASSWSKYTAFNLGRMVDLGTVEYRGMPGGLELEKTLQWTGVIAALHSAAQTISTEEINRQILSLNTSSSYTQFRDLVFGRELGATLPIVMFDRLLSRGITYAKDCFFVPDIPITKKVKPAKDSLMVLHAAHYAKSREKRIETANQAAQALDNDLNF